MRLSLILSLTACLNFTITDFEFTLQDRGVGSGHEYTASLAVRDLDGVYARSNEDSIWWAEAMKANTFCFKYCSGSYSSSPFLDFFFHFVLLLLVEF